MGKIWEKWLKVVNSGEKWRKKVGKSGKTWEKVSKSWKKWVKVVWRHRFKDTEGMMGPVVACSTTVSILHRTPAGQGSW